MFFFVIGGARIHSVDFLERAFGNLSYWKPHTHSVFSYSFVFTVLRKQNSGALI